MSGASRSFVPIIQNAPGPRGTNPYVTDGPPALRPSLVCYADILGYESLSRRALETGDGANFLRRVHAALTKAHQRVYERAKGFDEMRYFVTRVFTDNIVVGYPLRRPDTDLGEPETGDMFSIFAEFQ